MPEETTLAETTTAETTPGADAFIETRTRCGDAGTNPAETQKVWALQTRARHADGAAGRGGIVRVGTHPVPAARPGRAEASRFRDAPNREASAA